jgi:DNA polymerase-3 subunit alpha
MIRPEELAKKLKEMGHTAVAITDHGNLYGAVEITSIMAKYGIKAITGCEMYICDDVNVKDKDSRYYHLILLAKDNVGRLNLNKLVSQSSLYKYYGKPRIDFDMLTKYHEGLICTSACMAGEIARHLQDDDRETAKKIALKYKALFGEDFYIEYQSHEDIEQQILNKQLIELAEELDIPYVVTCDAHYLNEEDKKFHEIFVKIGTTREVGETYNDCYVQTEQEILDKCVSTKPYNEKAIMNTDLIAEKCENTIPLSAPIMPHVSIPDGYESELAYLKQLCNEGYIKKGFASWTLEQWKQYLTETVYDKDGNPEEHEIIHFDTLKEIRKMYLDRIRFEMNAIEKMGFEGYYLLVHSYVSCVKRRGIARGSSGGSIVAYLSGLVDIDPIKYGLYFERFIDVSALPKLETGEITPKQLKIPD